MNELRSLEERWGGNRHWALANGKCLVVSEAIILAGPGKGASMIPWALDHYERALRLRPGEAWLLRRMMKHAWEFKNQSYESMHKVELECIIDRKTLTRYVKRLQELGYVQCVADGDGTDRRKRYIVQNAFFALAICIAYDRTSEWAKAYGAISPEEAKNLIGLSGAKFQIDLGAIDAVVARKEKISDGDILTPSTGTN